MTCDELRPDYLAFALGVLDEPEKTELRAHLSRGCDRCTPGIREANQMAFAIGASAPQTELPRELRHRVLAAAGAAPQPKWHWRTAWQAIAATALVAVGIVFLQTSRKDSEIASLRQQLTRSGMESAGLREAVSLLQAPEMREVHFGEGAPAPPRGRVFYDSARILLIASNLPEPPAGKTYEMWVIPQGGKPAPAGLFSSSSQGTALHLYRSAAPVSRTDTVAVTLEAAAGATAPTTTPIIAVPL